MVKKYCDLCGKEVDSITEFTLPKEENIFATDKLGAKLIAGQVYKPNKQDLCPKCARRMYMFITQYMPYICSEDYVTHLQIYNKFVTDSKVDLKDKAIRALDKLKETCPDTKITIKTVNSTVTCKLSDANIYSDSCNNIIINAEKLLIERYLK